MPRVVPSQVVAVIEQWFPLEIQRGQNFSPNRDNTGQLMAIIDLMEQIPPELITLDSPKYNDLVIGLNIFRGAFPQWQMRDYPIKGVPGYSRTSPLTLIHQALKQCLDQAPSPQTAELSFIRPMSSGKICALTLAAPIGLLVTMNARPPLSWLGLSSRPYCYGRYKSRSQPRFRGPLAS
jgi:hypothetical protein